MGGFLTLGTGLLYYYRFFKKTQEDRAPELDEERESNSTLCSVSVVLNSLSGQVMNDDRESVLNHCIITIRPRRMMMFPLMILVLILVDQITNHLLWSSLS